MSEHNKECLGPNLTLSMEQKRENKSVSDSEIYVPGKKKGKRIRTHIDKK
jgi:hypothetical protein